MKRKITPPSDKIELMMTPMIDVVFQLLIFFMCGTKFRSPDGRVEAYLPKDVGTAAGQVNTEFDSIIVRVGEKGVLTVNGTRCDTYKDFYDRLLKLKADVVKPKVILDPHQQTEHRFVMQALDVCKKAGLHEVAFRAPMPPS